jgi:hypothetical protein
VCLDTADVVRDTPTILPKKIEDVREGPASGTESAARNGESAPAFD